MKLQIVLLLVLCGLITACDRRSDSSPAVDAAASQVQKDYDEQLKRQQAQLDAYDKQAKHAEEQAKGSISTAGDNRLNKAASMPPIAA